MKSGSLNFLEPSGPLQACNGTAFIWFYYKSIPQVLYLWSLQIVAERISRSHSKELRHNWLVPLNTEYHAVKPYGLFRISCGKLQDVTWDVLTTKCYTNNACPYNCYIAMSILMFQDSVRRCTTPGNRGVRWLTAGKCWHCQKGDLFYLSVRRIEHTELWVGHFEL